MLPNGKIGSGAFLGFFESRCVPEGSCVVWVGQRDLLGYGIVSLNRKPFRAHRIALDIHHGIEVPTDKVVCHSCDNPSCVKVDHLFIGTQADNIRDMIAKGRRVKVAPKVFCPHGHNYETSGWYPSKSRGRVCKACTAIRNANKRKAA